jgi:hypothetical protein
MYPNNQVSMSEMKVIDRKQKLEIINYTSHFNLTISKNDFLNHNQSYSFTGHCTVKI